MTPTMRPMNGSEAQCPIAGRPATRELPPGYDSKPTELLTNGKKQCPFFMPKTYGNGCQDGMCHGSHMLKYDEALGGQEVPEENVWEEAQDYINEFYYEHKLPEADRDARLAAIKKELDATGYYTHTFDELSFGVKTAWRNARRCIMRSQWNTMTTIDARHITDPEEMIDACLHHLDVTRNGGRIRPHVTVFPQKKPGREGPRIWNEQLLRYAAYKMEDGTIIGDPVNVEFTQICISLGWTPKYGKWDVLPLICMNDGGQPVWRDIPPKYAKEIHVTHPTYEWFSELDLRWFDHPPVSSFALSIGGIEYVAAPFSGWYMSTEIASRDLADEYRLNALPEIARRMGLPMSNRALWKDRAVLELNHAVLYSWDKAKTTMVDHHSASDSFIAHYDKELKTRGHCPADWVWITPPTSSATTRVFHQEMYSYLCKPAVLTLFEKPWNTYYKRMGMESPVKMDHEHDAPVVASQDTISIAYGTETGTALQYAERLHKFLNGRRLEVSKELIELDNVDLASIDHTLIVITSSFGDGEPPANAAEFNKIADAAALKTSCRYAVFGLGSTLYNETFQYFPKKVDSAIKKMGGRRVIPLGGCDETNDPDTAFTAWMTTLAVAIEVGTEANEATMEADAKDAAIAAIKQQIHHLSTFETLAITGGRVFFDRTNAAGEYRAAYNVEVTSADGTPLKYEEGDHVSLVPPTKSTDLLPLQAFLTKWGSKEVADISVKRIVCEFVDFTSQVDGKTVHKFLSQTEVSDENLEEIIQALPFKKPRHFSISSTPQFRPSTIQIAVARLAEGQVSVPITDAVKAKSVHYVKGCLRQSKFRIPADAQTPMILVGAGTGVGPLRGMIQGRLAAPTKGDVTKGAILAIFGFRSEDESIYREEFADISARGVDHYTAFSRGPKAQHVNDIMLRESRKIARLLENGGNFYVCGTTALGKSVEATLAQALEKSLGLSSDACKQYMATLRKEGRLQNDTYTR